MEPKGLALAPERREPFARSPWEKDVAPETAGCGRAQKLNQLLETLRRASRRRVAAEDERNGRGSPGVKVRDMGRESKSRLI